MSRNSMTRLTKKSAQWILVLWRTLGQVVWANRRLFWLWETTGSWNSWWGCREVNVSTGNCRIHCTWGGVWIMCQPSSSPSGIQVGASWKGKKSSIGKPLMSWWEGETVALTCCPLIFCPATIHFVIGSTLVTKSDVERKLAAAGWLDREDTSKCFPRIHRHMHTHARTRSQVHNQYWFCQTLLHIWSTTTLWIPVRPYVCEICLADPWTE